MRPLIFTLILAVNLLCWQDRVFAQAPIPPQATVSTPAAITLIDSAIKTLTRPEGVEVRFQQTIQGPSLPATLTGTCITAANKRVHVDLKFQQLKRESRLKLLCDGATFYRLESLPESNSLSSYTLQELQNVLDQLVTNEAERVAKEDVEKEQVGMHGFEGISAMVSDLKRRMIFSDPLFITIDQPGKPKLAVKVIEGRWTKDVLDMIAPPKKTNDPNQQDQRYLWNEKLSFFLIPRSAKLYFDSTTNQLVRVELWGITEKQGPEKVISQVELLAITPLTKLDPSLFQPTPEELKYKRETIDLATAVKNRHQETMNMLKSQQQTPK